MHWLQALIPVHERQSATQVRKQALGQPAEQRCAVPRPSQEQALLLGDVGPVLHIQHVQCIGMVRSGHHHEPQMPQQSLNRLQREAVAQ